MHREQDQTFAERYKSIKNQHPHIVTLNDDKIQKIADEITTSKRYYHTYTYIIAILSALFLFATYPPLIFKFYSFIISSQVQLSDILSQRQFIDNHLGISISAAFLFFSTFIYTILLPKQWFQKFFANNIVFNIISMDDFAKVDTSRPIYTTISLIMIYVVLIIPIVYFYSYELIPKIVIDAIATMWLMAPMLIFAIFPTVLFIFTISTLFVGRVQRASEIVPTAIIDCLVSLIYEIDNADEVKLPDKDLNNFLVQSIIRVSNLMRRNYRKPTFNDAISQWSIEQMETVADKFMLLATCVNFPKSDSLEYLRDRFCIYLNIFLSGHYQELLHEDKDCFNDVVLAQPKKYGVQKFIMPIFLATYLALPIIAIIIFVTLFKVDIQPFIQSLLTILYIIWGALGVTSFTENLSIDTKDFLRDILKSTIGK